MTNPTDTWEALHRAHTSITRALHHTPHFNATTLREHHVLDIISRAGPNGIRQNHLNQYLPLDQSSISRMTERLRTRGLITTWQDPNGHRGTRLSLTPAGKEHHTQTNTHHQAAITQIIEARLTPDEAATLAHLTTKLHTQDPL